MWVQILFLIVLAYAALGLFLFFFQEHFIFVPTALAKNFAYSFSLPGEESDFEFEGEKMNALYFAVESSPGLLLYFHGNKGTLEKWGEVAAELATRLGWSVCIFDYPGYGKSEGKIHSEAQFVGVSEAFYHYACEKYGQGKKIVLYGRSIGSGLAVRLASLHKVAGLILETPYYSLRQLAHEKVPFMPLFILRYTLRSDLFSPKVSCPTLIFHGTADPVIPFHHGQQLAKALPQSQFIKVPGGGHNDSSQLAEYWPRLKKFLDDTTIVHF